MLVVALARLSYTEHMKYRMTINGMPYVVKKHCIHLHDANYSTIKVQIGVKKRLIIISLFTTNDTFIGIYSRQQRKFTTRNYSLHLMITVLAMIGKSRRTKMRFWNVHTSSPVGCNWRRNYSFLYNLTYHLYSCSMYIQYRQKTFGRIFIFMKYGTFLLVLVRGLEFLL